MKIELVDGLRLTAGIGLDRTLVWGGSADGWNVVDNQGLDQLGGSSIEREQFIRESLADGFYKVIEDGPETPNQGEKRAGHALRFNAGKPELIYPDMFPAALEGVARVYMYGTQRPVNPYPKFNFTKPAPFTELYNCARRHMVKWFNGEDMDPDAVAAGFDVNHLDAAIGNLMRLRQQIADVPHEDDRPCKVKVA